jgi:1-acyl-sn-glycerol-3-phosphate acyltransferase
MGDLFYKFFRFAFTPPFWVSSDPLVVNAGVTARRSPYILAANHQSPYDIPVLIRHCRRAIDFVSIVEVFRTPFLGWFYGHMNAFPLDRSKPDSPTVRTILSRLKQGRAVGMFPEGRFRTGRDSVVYTRRIRPGIGRIATLANVPVIPCIILGAEAYSRFDSWLPRKQTRYGVQFGEPIDPSIGAEAIEAKLVDELVRLHGELSVRMKTVSRG